MFLPERDKLITRWSNFWATLQKQRPSWDGHQRWIAICAEDEKSFANIGRNKICPKKSQNIRSNEARPDGLNKVFRIHSCILFRWTSRPLWKTWWTLTLPLWRGTRWRKPFLVQSWPHNSGFHPKSFSFHKHKAKEMSKSLLFSILSLFFLKLCI